ncbi:putative cellulose 1,4-beta-cellobiosidase II precursor [Collybia nuda]|uniref:Glucanase n=1 Tax=Collybia nuda TaxID=64659 RepID=A0A9P5YC60_9AGAR|nr:putative cellulose 1,4-beta-cellobiosidase II precursor [Collybia nuda]
MARFFSTLLALIALGVFPAIATPPPPSSISTFNPFTGKTFFVNSVRAAAVHKAANQIAASGDFALATSAHKVAQVSTFHWVDKTAAIPSITTWLNEARQAQIRTGKSQVFQLVVYNLPDRDCSAKASSGELEYANGGEEKYKSFIHQVRQRLAAFPDIRIVIQLETDAIGNMVTGLSVPKCANAAPAQKRSYAYAIANLQLPNVALYLDGAHSAWLGWPGNIEGAANNLIEIVNAAKALNPRATVRGVSTNVSNYNGLGNQEQTGYDELVYVQNLAVLLKAQGWDAHFIVDQGRSGNQVALRSGGDWCNFKMAGFGPRPSTNTPSELIDAIVWVKPGGDSDGTSDTTAERFDEACGSSTSIIPSPEAGAWNQLAFISLVKQANPAF